MCKRGRNWSKLGWLFERPRGIVGKHSKLWQAYQEEMSNYAYPTENLKEIHKHFSQKNNWNFGTRSKFILWLVSAMKFFSDIPDYQLDRLKKVQNQAARIVSSSYPD